MSEGVGEGDTAITADGGYLFYVFSALTSCAAGVPTRTKQHHTRPQVIERERRPKATSAYFVRGYLGEMGSRPTYFLCLVSVRSTCHPCDHVSCVLDKRRDNDAVRAMPKIIELQCCSVAYTQ